MNKQKIRSQKHVEKQKKRRRRRWIAVVVLALVLLGGLIALSHWSAIQINSFSIQADDDLPEEQIRNVVSTQLDDRLWFVFARNNVVLLPRTDITNRITSLTPRIKDSTIDLTGLDSFVVTIQTRQPVVQVCPPKSSTTTRDCLLVDRTGYTYAQADDDQATSSDLFVYRSDNANVGTQLAPESTFRLLQSFLDKLPELSFQPLMVSFKDHQDVFIATREQSATTTASSTTVELRVNLADDLNQKYTDLKTVVEKGAFVASTTEETINGSKPSISPFTLEYIDLRFGNKVFYK